ncbi:hypothetical protein J7K28_03310, partial [Candidatus Aerophobetes bacterium]|nr:hypothetical protein [Candidatus Aerophobetes bacterium]
MSNLLIWSADPMQKVFKDDFPPEKATCQVIMESARGALATGQIAVKSSKEETLKIKPFKLKEEKTGEEVTIIPRFVGFVMVNVNTPDTPIRPILRCPLSGEIDREAPCKIPDPLLENECLRVDPKETQPIWLMAEIPIKQKPGVYRGEFKFTVSHHPESVPVELRVYNATVPKERHLWVVNHLRAEPLAEFYRVGLWSSEHWEILENFARDMALHRQTMINPPLFSLVKIIEDKKGLSFDFTLYDRFVELFKKAGVVGRIEGSPLASSNRKVAFLPEVKILSPEGKVIHTQPPLNIRSPEARKFLS